MDENMTAKEMISALSSVPESSHIICGESPFTMYVVSNNFLHMQFIGMRGSPPIRVDINRPVK